MALPKTTRIAQNDTHRLIPTRVLEEGETVLSRLGLPRAQMEDLFRLDDATNERVQAEANLLPGITVHELVFGVPHYHIINAAFTHAQPKGSRFSGADRGAWYSSFALKTSQTEVLFHYANSLREIDWEEDETTSFRDYLADFRGQFHDIRGDNAFRKCLDPHGYKAGQKLGRQLLERGSTGVVYPSVRHAGGTCLVCFRPAMVANVREGPLVTATFSPGSESPRVKVSR